MGVAEALIAQPSSHLPSIATHTKRTLAESPREGGRRWRKVATDAFYECNFLIAHCEAIKEGIAPIIVAGVGGVQFMYYVQQRTAVCL